MLSQDAECHPQTFEIVQDVNRIDTENTDTENTQGVFKPSLNTKQCLLTDMKDQ